MFKLFAIVICLGASVHCQREDRIAAPTRYVLPYAGLEGYDDQQDSVKEEQPLRRSERIPATAYQYDDGLGEDDYYRPQPRQKVEPESQYHSSTRDSTPSHKDYEQILKTTHLARLRAQAKKQPQLQHPSNIPQPAVEQYLKEVSPTTSTAYQRPSNYLRFGGQPKQEQSEEAPRAAKQPSYRYVLQPEHQQKAYPQYQYETQEQLKPLPPKNPTPFNLVAYQNALLAQQKVLAEVEGQDDPASKSSIYVSQNIAKKQKNVKQKAARPSNQQFDYYPQVPRRPQPAYSQESPRYQQPSRNVYQKPETGFEDYPEPKEEQYQPPTRQPKPTPKTRTPTRKPKYQTEEPSEDYPSVAPVKEQTKYQSEDPAYDYQPNLKYQSEEQPLSYRRPSGRQPKPPKYQQNLEEPQSEKTDFLPYQPKYQPEPAPRRLPVQYQQDPELRPVPSRYLSRQQYQEESQQFPQYVDLAYQGSSEVPVRYLTRTPVSYRSPSIRYYRSLGNPTSYVE